MSNDTIQLSGSQTITLGSAGNRVLEVTTGGVELFLVWNRDGVLMRRTHFASVLAGQWIFDHGFASADKNLSLLVVGQPDTQVRVVPAAECVGELANKQLSTWFSDLYAGLATLVGPSPITPINIAAGVVPAIVAGTTISARSEVLWWKPSDGFALLFGAVLLEADQSAQVSSQVIKGAFPISSQSWLVCPADMTQSKAFTCAEIVASDQWLDCLLPAHELCLRTIQTCVLDREGEDEVAQQRRRQLRENAGQDAWNTLVKVLVPREEDDVQIPEGLTQPIARVFVMVAAATGIDVLSGPSQMPSDMSSAVAALARTAKVRYREVILLKDWQKKDVGPLIGFSLSDSAPLALLFRRGRYCVVNADGVTVPVDFSAIAPMAYMLYRSLPSRPLGFMDVARFCAAGNSRDLLMLLVMIVITGLLGIVLPMLTAQIFDVVIPQAERLLMTQIGVALISAALVKLLFEIVRGFALYRMQMRVESGLQAAVWDRLLKLPTQFFRRFTAGDLTMRAQAISTVGTELTATGSVVLLALPTGLFNFIVMFTYESKLAYWGLGLAAVGLVAGIGLSLPRMRLLRKETELEGKIAGTQFQIINGVAKFRLAGAESLAFATWAKSFAEIQQMSMQAGRWQIALQTFFAGFPVLTTLSLFYLAGTGMGASSGAISTFVGGFPVFGSGASQASGTFLAFYASFGALIASMTTLTQGFISLLPLLPQMERTKPIFQATPEVSSERASPGQLTGAVEVSGIRFGYDPNMPPILRDVSIRIEPNQFVAIVGPSGCGKSTLLRLLLGFEKPEQGMVFYDGKDLATLELREVRRQIGVVMQSSTVNAGDIFRNIVGESSLTLNQAWEAAAQAGLADDIRAMPMGMHTVISEGGAGFSGGQKQRLSIARALARKPKILFFDEATSALDNRTQAIVSASLNDLHVTRLVIAHRLSTVRDADRIIVLREGAIAEQGTYDELMALNGFFAELARRQIA